MTRANSKSSNPVTTGRPDDAIEQRAAEWRALRGGRNFTAAEQAEFDAWIAADPQHAGAVNELEAAERVFDRLKYFPHDSDERDADLLARPGASWIRRRAPAFFAAAAAIAIGAFLVFRASPLLTLPANTMTVAESSQVMRLPDGSEVEIKTGSEVRAAFVPTERRVLLIRGEAHFTVTKDEARPFVVEAAGVAVRAVGTAFNVRVSSSEVEVLVTEGTVHVAPPLEEKVVETAASTIARVAPATSILIAGERAVVATTIERSSANSRVQTLAPSEIDKVLAWQKTRIVFDEVPLGEVAARFNRALARPNADAPVTRLIVADVNLSAMPITGRFRADNVESFIQLLEASFGIAATRKSSGEVVLRKSR